MSGELPKETYISRYGSKTRFYGTDRVNNFAKPLYVPRKAEFSRMSAPGWFHALSATALGAYIYVYYFLETIPGSKNRHFVVRRDAGIIGDDGFVDNIYTKGTDPKYLTRDYLRSGSSDRDRESS
eukprot:TRINITY_DN2196_c3_g2_i2.p1 TRINITY_DN2196_c3_g2~~TRINITY_DN2196_c3_g2_i2.p1  ORF type:complete len:125 (+),score=14.25 TRINITY_DN2196_c3_g2_i2:66-440(+)